MFQPLRLLLFPVLGLLIVSFGCRKSEHNKTSSKPVSVFSMKVNGQLWEPSSSADDPCYSTYRCMWSAVDEIPYYTIDASRGVESENIFRFQVMGVTHPGVYNIDGSYKEDFTSYAYFITNKNEAHKMYANNMTDPSTQVTIEEIIPQDHLSVPGIIGSFSGVLYNVDDKQDSIIIDDCRFVFRKTNGDFNQCD